MAIKYTKPTSWFIYDAQQVSSSLINAKAAVLSLKNAPYQRSWGEPLKKMQLKMEVAGTSRIEGAEFTDAELDEALTTNAINEDLVTRSQKQARAALQTYKWIGQLEDDVPISESLVVEVHRRIVTGCDDDHCEPGKIRPRDHNVTFGSPAHRGANGGQECGEVFETLLTEFNSTFQSHDPLLRALALHYHFAAIHPFMDGNGRTARALEALVLQRNGLRDVMFIAMSNYYYDEKAQYLRVLGDVRASNHDLTEFFIFGLKGIELQCQRLYSEIKKNVQTALFKNMMYDLFNRLKSTRKRVIAERQLSILNVLLENERLEMHVADVWKQQKYLYSNLSKPNLAFFRDISELLTIEAINFREPENEDSNYSIFINLEWPTNITESAFFKKIKQMPKAKTHKFLR